MTTNALAKNKIKPEGRYLIYSHRSSCNSCTRPLLIKMYSNYSSYELATEEITRLKVTASLLHHLTGAPRCACCGEVTEAKALHLVPMVEITGPVHSAYAAWHPQPYDFVLTHQTCLGLINKS